MVDSVDNDDLITEEAFRWTPAREKVEKPQKTAANSLRGQVNEAMGANINRNHHTGCDLMMQPRKGRS